MRRGDRIGKMTVMASLSPRLNALWLLKCDCGKHRVHSRMQLRETLGECDGDCNDWTPQIEIVQPVNLNRLSKQYNMSVKVLRRRLERQWSLERALECQEDK